MLLRNVDEIAILAEIYTEGVCKHRMPENSASHRKLEKPLSTADNAHSLNLLSPAAYFTGADSGIRLVEVVAATRWPGEWKVVLASAIRVFYTVDTERQEWWCWKKSSRGSKAPGESGGKSGECPLPLRIQLNPSVF